ncbi:MAG: diguanylate cyclase [Acidimicrobiales bacterium]
MDQAAEVMDEAPSPAAAVLEPLLLANPHAVVMALASDGRPTEIPASLGVPDRSASVRASGVDLLVAADHPKVLAAWQRAEHEPIVELEVRLVADPDRPVGLYFLDVRAEHGVHLTVLDVADPAMVTASTETIDGRRRVVGHVQRDPLGSFLAIDAEASAILGWSAAEIIGRSTLDLVHPEDSERAVEGWMAMRSGVGGGRAQVRFQHARGHYVWLEITNENHLDDPALGCVISELVDISDEMAALEELHQRERELQRLAEAMPVGICHLRMDEEVVYTNAPLVALLGEVTSVPTLLAALAPADHEPVRQAIERARAGEGSDLEVGVVHGAEPRRAELTFRTLQDDDADPAGLIVCAADVTDRCRLRSELEHRASHDSLSGCLNRAATVEAIEEHLVEAHPVAVAFLDLDDFKVVNDQFGHAAGDEVLRAVASRLRRATRAEDRVGRVGGDEFVVICPQGREPMEPSALVERLATALNGSIEVGGHMIPLTVSVGVASSDGSDGLGAEGLLSLADDSMYERKRADAVPPPP